MKAKVVKEESWNTWKRRHREERKMDSGDAYIGSIASAPLKQHINMRNIRKDNAIDLYSLYIILIEYFMRLPVYLFYTIHSEHKSHDRIQNGNFLPRVSMIKFFRCCERELNSFCMVKRLGMVDIIGKWERLVKVNIIVCVGGNKANESENVWWKIFWM